MDLNRRNFQPDDYWRIRKFLRDTLIANSYFQRAWDVQRFDYWRWHGIENCDPMPLEEVVFLWESRDGQIEAVLNPEGRGDAFFQVHPHFRTPALEQEMIATAEEYLSKPGQNGARRLTIWANAGDHLRERLLHDCGYTKTGTPEYVRRRPIELPIPGAAPRPGYTIRSLGDQAELPARSWASWRAFHPDAPDAEYEGCQWYLNIQRAPLYRRDLDLVAVAPTGEIAGFVTIWFDDVTRTALFEPVGVVPEHQRKGLGLSLMAEGLRRLSLLGASMVYVGSYSEAAGGLYAALGFTEYELSWPWIKEWKL